MTTNRHLGFVVSCQISIEIFRYFARRGVGTNFKPPFLSIHNLRDPSRSTVDENVARKRVFAARQRAVCVRLDVRVTPRRSFAFESKSLKHGDSYFRVYLRHLLHHPHHLPGGREHSRVTGPQRSAFFRNEMGLRKSGGSD